MRPAAKRYLFIAGGCFLGLYAGYVGFIWWSMHQPPETFGRVMAKMPATAVFLTAPFETMWTCARSGHLHAGDLAPDFVLKKLDGSDPVRLSAVTAEKPVVLVFGSYT